MLSAAAANRPSNVKPFSCLIAFLSGSVLLLISSKNGGLQITASNLFFPLKENPEDHALRGMKKGQQIHYLVLWEKRE